MTWAIAHRGASWELPENTPAAFERAIELGADFVEFDLHAAADGSLVVCHDPPRGGEPSLEEVVEQCSGRIGLMCELKSPWRYRRHDVVARVERLLPADAIVVSFEQRALEQVRRLRTLQHVGLGVSIRRRRDARVGGRLLGPARSAPRDRAGAQSRPEDDGLHRQRSSADARARRPRRRRDLQRPSGSAAGGGSSVSTRAVSPGKRACTFMPTG